MAPRCAVGVMTSPPASEAVPADRELRALLQVEEAARALASFTHSNLGDRRRYRAREEAVERLRDALARLDRVRGPS